MGKVDHVLPPVVLLGVPFPEAVTVCAEAEKVVLRFARLWGCATELAAWLNELHRIQRATTLLAFVATRVFVAAVRTGALYVAIGEKAVVLGAIEHEHLVSIDVSLLQELEKDALRCLTMVVRPGRREEIHGDAEPFE